jgi:hypothetical protein
VAAQPPSGALPVNLERYDELMSIGSEIVNKGFLSDAIHFGLSDTMISMLPSGRLGLSREDTYQEAIGKFRAVNVSSHLRNAADHFARHWPKSTPGSTPDYFEELQKAFLEEFGLTLSEWAEFTGSIIRIGMDAQSEPKKSTLAQFTEQVAEDLGWTAQRVGQVVARFSLVARGDFFDGPLGEIYPWRYGRDLSYLRRPFVLTGSEDEVSVVWGNRHLETAGRTLVRVCTSGRLKAQTSAMKRFMGASRAIEPEVFNDDVAAVFADQADLIVRSRVKKFGKLRLARANGEDLGDIDVLIADTRRRRLVAVETKDFETARTPSELARELAKLLTGPKSANGLHAARVDWVRDHRREILDWLGVAGSSTKWSVAGLIVVSNDLMTPLLAESRFPVLTLAQVRDASLRARLGET